MQLGVLSITVRGDKKDAVEQTVIDQAGQLGVIIADLEANILVAGGTIILSNQIVGDERRIETMKLVKTWTDKGSDVLTITNEVRKRVKEMNSLTVEYEQA